jgi:hypothetical protein
MLLVSIFETSSILFAASFESKLVVCAASFDLETISKILSAATSFEGSFEIETSRVYYSLLVSISKLILCICIILCLLLLYGL